uniref:WW domain-containing protein n=1 Tax=Lygus hesperus TaxID=30085 RepID=A0A0A9XQ60_LYGHE
MMSNTTTLQPSTIVCEEVFDENSLPSNEEVIDYAKKIGIDPQCESHLLPIALKGLMEPLPKGWKPCLDKSIDRWYYFNKVTKVSQWEHPLDPVYRNLVKRGRSEGYSSAAEDDSKGTAREDLKSFEEVSDLLSSNTDKPEVLDDNMFIDKGRPKTHQPLLLRRKQLQNGAEQSPMSSLQVAKLMNNTMRDTNFQDMSDVADPQPPNRFQSSDIEQEDSVIFVGSKNLQPLQRSRTLDPIPTFTSNAKPDAVPIKGILRESSFSGLPNRNLSKPNALSAELTGSTNDLEDEKKRSVRFADTERKSLDIRFQFSDDSEETSSQDEDPGDSGSSSSAEEPHSHELGRIKDPKRSKNKFNIAADNLELVNQKINAINVNKMKEKFMHSRAALEMASLGNGSEDDTDDSNNHSRPPASFKVMNHSKEEKTGRFHVSKVQVTEPSGLIETRASSGPEKELEKFNNVVGESKEEPSHDLDPEEVDEIATRKTAERLAQLEERITKEIQEKIGILKQQQNDKLAQMSAELLEEHEAEKIKISNEHSARIQALKQSLDDELQTKEEELRAQHKIEVDELIEKLENERNSLTAAAEAHHGLLLKSTKEQAEESFELEKSKIETEFEAKLQAQREKVVAEMESLHAAETARLEELKSVSEQKVEEMKLHYEALAKEEEAKFKREALKLETDFNTRMNALKLEKETELHRIKTEWDDKITATALQHRASLESLMTEHDRSLSVLKQQFQKEEDELKRSHAEQIEAWNLRLKKLVDKEPNSLSVNRDFEKMRCEKRLLEDKYRSLKDKYLQLKTDMKIAVERKLQSRARRRKDVLFEKEQDDDKHIGDQKTRNEKNKNNNISENVVGAEEKIRIRNPRINIEQITQKDPQKEGGENDPSSDDQYTSLSLTLPTDDQRSLSISPIKTEPDLKRKYSRGRFRIEYRKEGQGNVLDEVRSQLKELEEIEEQIPANSQGDTYLRYPFHGPGLSTSAEVDFYRHRVIVEQEAVRAARECLLQQKRELEARQNILRTNNNSSNMQQLQQQERDLTEMEVSLHRTRALLGEKMIRLRLLGQTLNRLVDESPSPTNQSGALKIEQALSPGAVSDDGYPRPPIKSVKSHRRLPSNKAEIEARIQGLRDWLEKPPSSNIDWNQLTL